MRIAADDDLYGLLQAQGRDVEVFLDGILQRSVICACEERGEVYREADPPGTGPVTLRGQVRIEIVRRDRPKREVVPRAWFDEEQRKLK